MSNLGLGVMIQNLAGNKDSVEAFKQSMGKEIAELDLSEDRLLFTFSDGTKMQLSDDGQSCCEHRYMHSDAKLESFVGSVLTDAVVLDAPSLPENEWDEVHDIQFLVIYTSIGVFTIETHNEHNGYYGGFAIRAALVE